MPSLAGPEKAVLFLLSLDEAIAGPIVSGLGEEDLKRLRKVAATMHEVPVNAVDETCKEFLDRSSLAVAVPRGGLTYLRRLSAGALGEEKARALFDEHALASPFSKLEAAPADALASLLSKEPPQVIGALLARVSPEAAAKVLAALPEERQAAVLAHVSRVTELPSQVLEDVAAALADELPEDEAGSMAPIDGVARAAKILNASGKDAARAMLFALEAVDQALADHVRTAMFTFDDLARVDPRAMREILREVPTERLTVALKNASDDVAAAVFSGLSQRAADLIRDDLEVRGAIKKSDIDAARIEVVQAALRIESEGRIDLRGDS